MISAGGGGGEIPTSLDKPPHDNLFDSFGLSSPSRPGTQRLVVLPRERIRTRASEATKPTPKGGVKTHGERSYVRLNGRVWSSRGYKTDDGSRCCECGTARQQLEREGGFTAYPAPRPRGRARKASPRSAQQHRWHWPSRDAFEHNDAFSSGISLRPLPPAALHLGPRHPASLGFPHRAWRRSCGRSGKRAPLQDPFASRSGRGLGPVFKGKWPGEERFSGSPNKSLRQK